jgi:hypothetical protein
MNSNLLPPQNPNEFFPWFKAESEKMWASLPPNDPRAVLKWLPGLSDAQINDFEKMMGFAFPDIYRMFLSCMNGTEERYHSEERDGAWDSDGYFATFKVEVSDHLFHSYPRDLHDITKLIDRACKLYGVKRSELDKKGIPHIMPLLKRNRFLIMDRCEINPVFAIITARPGDRIPVNNSLSMYLFSSIFQTPPPQPLATEDIESIYSSIKFWLDDPVLVSRWGFSDVRKIRLATVYDEVNIDTGRKRSRFEFKLRITKRLLADGNRVRVSVVYDGKKIQYPDIGLELLHRMLDGLKEDAAVEEQPRVLKKEWTMLLAPISRQVSRGW